MGTRFRSWTQSEEGSVAERGGRGEGGMMAKRAEEPLSEATGWDLF